jgi:hypothetical protein
MSESDQFRQYAEEALLWAAQSKTEEKKRLLFELVLTWTQAAFASDRIELRAWRSCRRQIRDGARGLVRMKTRF